MLPFVHMVSVYLSQSPRVIICVFITKEAHPILCSQLQKHGVSRWLTLDVPCLACSVKPSKFNLILTSGLYKDTA